MPQLFTIGHSTRTISEFIGLLQAHGVDEIVDVRTIPKSRHNPQFNGEDLRQSLELRDIGYIHLESLGGLRHARNDSINLGWHNASFRGYADYMATQEFRDGLAELMKIASSRLTAIMCAEAVPWRCHRSLIADAITIQGWAVRDIMSLASAPEHRQTPFLKAENGQLTYPALEE